MSGHSRLNPATPLGYAQMLVRRQIDRARSRTIDTPSDLGASVVEWVIITALLVGMAVAVGAILLAKVTSKAHDIDLGAAG